MREHKYRAWDKEYSHMYHAAWPFEHMVYVEMPAHDDQCNPLPINGNKFYNMNGKTFYFLMQKHVELMQYTGLKDSKGTEIFEGDIIALTLDDGTILHANIGIVRFGKVNLGSNGFEYDYWINGFYVETMGEGSEYRTDMMVEGKVAIVGNIYENPELLKEV